MLYLPNLFSSGQQGAWYDPSDLSTLFQDSAGTTPVTAMEQPVGRILDISGNSNHAFQATSTKRGVVSRRVNATTESEFRNGISNLTVAVNVTASAMEGYLGAIAVGAGAANAYKSVFSLANVAHVISAIVEMDDGLPPSFASASPSNSANDFVFVLMNNIVSPPNDYKVVSLGGSRYKVSTTYAPPTATNGNTGILKYAGNSARTFKFTALDVRLAIDAHLPYQWVNTAADYDTDPNKFPTYIRFDGVDDAYQTNSIDFTGTDKMTVWAGVTKLSDAAVGILAELSTIADSNFGAFYMTAPSGTGANGDFRFQSGGTIYNSAVLSGAVLAPVSVSVTGIGDISGTKKIIRINGISLGSGILPQGSGNYGNYPLFIGGRGGTSVFFNGRLYSLIVAGANYPLPQIESVEYYMKRKMKLP